MAPDRLPRMAPLWWTLAGLLLAMLALPWMQHDLARLWPESGPFLRRYLAAAVIGGLVGGAELVARYRDEPWQVIGSPPGLAFIALNAGAAFFALFLLEHFRHTLAAPNDGFARVMIAGFGAMVVLRSKLLTLRQPGGTDVEVGPAFVVESLLSAVNRDVDRRRAGERIDLVTAMADAFKDHDFDAVAQHLVAALLAFQGLDPEERKMLNDRVRDLVEGTGRGLPDRVRFTMVGYDYLTAFGEEAFVTAFDALNKALAAKAGPTATASPPAFG
jgi:hypothetical protein